MNEFIVWDEKKKRFLDADEFAIDNNGSVYHWLNDNSLQPMKKYQLFKRIGKTDINGKKIYADSSIVEFEYEDRIPTLLDDDVIIKFTAYFQYHPDELRYELIILDYDRTKTKSIYSVLSYNMDLMKNLKVIGTIQQDKHLLGEEK